MYGYKDYTRGDWNKVLITNDTFWTRGIIPIQAVNCISFQVHLQVIKHHQKSNINSHVPTPNNSGNPHTNISRLAKVHFLFYA